MENKVFPATKAFVVYTGRVLIIRESSNYKEGTSPGRYDVSGGRVKSGQTYYQSLLREIREETGLVVRIRNRHKPFHIDEWRVDIHGDELQIVGAYFECFADSDQVILSKDHDRFEWINPEDYGKFNLIPGLERAFESYLALNR
ncbi:MAG TPA: NUDIX domain-containing protein [Candidatus Pacearchaeota archaeon]|nr:NUDIX domain-containing protein [Candidatus Pacearchaeota archaeon]